jgi:hypothetical protein
MPLQHCRQKKGTGSSVKLAPQVSHSTGKITCKSCRMIAAGLGIVPRDVSAESWLVLYPVRNSVGDVNVVRRRQGVV